MFLSLAGALMAQSAIPVPASSPIVPTISPVVVSNQGYSPAQLETLLGPIALYPDALVATILPATTEPADIVLAARFLAAGGDPTQIQYQGWDMSVQSLAHYPQVVAFLSQNLGWTQAVGAAFVRQPADVMVAVQQLRMLARASGALRDSPQQSVVVTDSAIAILPAQPDVIYIPQYNPNTVYLASSAPPAGPLISFGVGFPVGAWLSFNCNWLALNVWVGPWQPTCWYSPPAVWRSRAVVAVGNPWCTWQPSARLVSVTNRHYSSPVASWSGPNTRLAVNVPQYATARPSAYQPAYGRASAVPNYNASVMAGLPPGAMPRPRTAAPSIIGQPHPHQDLFGPAQLDHAPTPVGPTSFRSAPRYAAGE